MLCECRRFDEKRLQGRSIKMIILQGSHGSVTYQGAVLVCHRLWRVNKGRYLPIRYLKPTLRNHAQKSMTPKQVSLGLDPRSTKSEFSNLALIQTGVEM